MPAHEDMESATAFKPFDEAKFETWIDQGVGDPYDVRNRLSDTAQPPSQPPSVAIVANEVPKTPSPEPGDENPPTQRDIDKTRLLVLRNLPRETVSAERLEELLAASDATLFRELMHLVGIASTIESAKREGSSISTPHHRIVLESRALRKARGFDPFHPRG